MLRVLAAGLVVFGVFGVPESRALFARQAAPKRASDQTRSSLRYDSGYETFAPGESEVRLSNLLQERAVRMAIKLDDDQVSKIAALQRSFFKRFLPIMMDLRNTRDPARHAQLGNEFNDVDKELMTAINARLTGDQLRRLLEIAVQLGGFRALLIPEVADAVEITPETQDLIKKIKREMHFEDARVETKFQVENGREIEHFPDRNWEEFRKSKPYLARHKQFVQTIDANHAEARRQVLSLLTKEQREKFAQMSGAPFDPKKYRTVDPKRPRTNS